MNFLFCGHDFKFLTPVMNYVASRRDVTVRVQQTKGHTLDEANLKLAEENVAWADIVFCEWAMGNAVWYSEHKRPGQLLVVRMHFQEFHDGLPYLDQVRWESVDSFVVICTDAIAYVREHLPQIAPRTRLIFNPLDIFGRFSNARCAYSDLTLGYLGMVPFRKRPDLALDILEACRATGKDFRLCIKGKRPQDYPWMLKRQDEMARYEESFDRRLRGELEKAVVFDGFDPNPGAWYAKCGFLLSTSDFEGSHQAVAEGMAQGCIPVIRNWSGADGIYPRANIFRSVEEAKSLILESRRNPDAYFALCQRNREYAVAHFEAREICGQYDDVFAAHKDWIPLKEEHGLSSLCVAQLVWIPPGAHNGYRVRVSKFSAQYHALGMRTVIICLHNGAASEEERAAHVRELEGLGCHAYMVQVDGFFSLKMKAEQEEDACAKLLPILDAEHVDILQCHAVYCARVGRRLKAERPGLVYSCVFHGIIPEESRMSGAAENRVQALERLELEILKSVDLANFVSHAEGVHYMRKYGVVPPSNVVPSGLREEAMRKNIVSRDILDLPGGRPVLGYVGTMVAWQCRDEMFALFGKLHRLYPEIFFAVLTPENDWTVTRELLERNGISERDCLVCEVPFEQVSAAVSQFNAGVMLRKWSPVNRVASPTKFGEMIAAGVPIVATDGIGDYSEDVRGNGFGLIVPHQELDAVDFSDETCKAIRCLLEKRLNEDPDFISRTTAFCEKNLIWERHVTEMAWLYWRLKYVRVDGAPGTPPKGDEGFEGRMLRKIDGLPRSNGCRYYERFRTKIGIICDEFYWDSVKDAADFVYLSCDDWEDKIKDIEVLYLVSAWHGLKNDDWLNLSREGTPKRLMVYDMIARCRKRGIPTVFYSKEDPPNYDRFIGIARHCDHVFTSCEEVIPRYVKDCGHKRVYPMCFGINPVEHNPIGTRFREKERNVIFSGSWMMKYPHRCEALAKMFDGVLASGRGINIVDRNYGNRGNSAYAYPERFRSFQSPAIGHENLQRIHRLYDWAININSVQDSRTMFANRVYELQACGNLLISNDSLGVREKFPGVFIVRTSDEVSKILSEMTPEEVRRRQLAGIRRVMTGETCFDRIAYMLTRVGIKTEVPVRKVLVVARELSQKVRETFDRQTYPYKTLVEESDVTDALKAKYDLFAYFDDGNSYDEFYLEDMINVFKYTNCERVHFADYGRMTYGSTSVGQGLTVSWMSGLSKAGGAYEL